MRSDRSPSLVVVAADDEARVEVVSPALPRSSLAGPSPANAFPKSTDSARFRDPIGTYVSRVVSIPISDL